MLIDTRGWEPEPERRRSLPSVDVRRLASPALAVLAFLWSIALGGVAAYVLLLVAIVFAARTVDRHLGYRGGLREHRQ